MPTAITDAAAVSSSACIGVPDQTNRQYQPRNECCCSHVSPRFLFVGVHPTATETGAQAVVHRVSIGFSWRRSS